MASQSDPFKTSSKLNSYIAANFDNNLGEIPEEFQALASSIRLVDMLDFSQVVFQKQIALVSKSATSVSTKYPKAKLSQLAQILNGGTPDTDNPLYWDGGIICWATLVDTKQKYLTDTEWKITEAGLSATTLLPINTVIFSSRATIGEVCINLVPTATNQGYKNFVCDPDKLHYEYLYHLLVFLRPVLINLVPSGSKYKEINTETISNFEIPLPPLSIQKEIANECNRVDADAEKFKVILANAQNEVEKLTDSVYASSFPRIEIDKLTLNIQYGLSEKMNEAGIGFKIFRMNEIIQGRMVDNGSMKYIDISEEEFANYKLNPGDLLFNRTNSIEHVGKTGLFNLEGDYCFASYLVRVVPDTNKVLPLFLARMMNSSEFQSEAKSKASKSINQANINATVMRNIKIPVPPLSEQKKFIKRVEKLEERIDESQVVVNAALAKKEEIIRRLL